MAPSPHNGQLCGVGAGAEHSDSWNTPQPVLCVSRHECRSSSVKRSISKSPLFCKKGLTATLSCTELCVANHSTMVLYDMQKYDNSIFKNNGQGSAISCLSKHLSYVKRGRLLASPIRLILCGLSPLYNKGAKRSAVHLAPEKYVPLYATQGISFVNYKGL